MSLFPTQTIMTRAQLRAMQRERQRASEKALAKVLGMPKGLRQYCARLGKQPSDVAQAYVKHGQGALA